MLLVKASNTLFWSIASYGTPSTQSEAGDAQSKVDAYLPLKCERLQRYRPVRSPDKEFPACAHAKRRISARTNVMASERPVWKRGCWRKHGPSHCASSPKPDIQAYARNRAGVHFRITTHVRREAALQTLMGADNQTN
jgi:hypothetical protein